MTKILVAGCSMANGHSLKGMKIQDVNDPLIWPNLLSRHFARPEVHNLSVSGFNNHSIFIETMSALIKHHYDVVIVSWSQLGRINLRVGLELYSTLSKLNDHDDINLNPGVQISNKWLNSIGDNLRKIQNDHWLLLDLVKYVNTLYHLQATVRGSDIFFVNSMMDFLPLGYFEKKEYATPSELDTYTQELLNVNSRDDDEIRKLYCMIHNQYESYGGIQSQAWLNLYHSLQSLQIDNAQPKDQHPGYQSQKLFAEYLVEKIKDKD